MSIKLRYALLFIGCLAHAEFLSLTLAHEFWNKELYHILWPGAFYPAWWILVIVWPAWVGLLWKYGAKENRALGVVVPIVLGLIIMWPVLGMLLYGLAISLGGLH